MTEVVYRGNKHNGELPTAESTLGVISGAKEKINQLEDKQNKQKEQSASEISDAIKNFALPIVDQLPHSILVKIGTFSTPEEDYVHFAIYVPSSHRLLSRLFTINRTELIYPHIRVVEAGDWIEFGDDVVASIKRATEAKKSGIDLTLSDQLSWYQNLEPDVRVPTDLLEIINFA